MKITKLTESLSYEEMRKIIDLNYTAKEILDLAKETLNDKEEKEQVKNKKMHMQYYLTTSSTKILMNLES